MKPLAVALLALASLLFGAGQKRNQPKLKPPEVVVLDASARRVDGRVALDGRLKNAGERPAQGLILLFDFMAPGRQVITTKRGPIDEELLAPGQEAEFHAHIVDPVRAVEFRIAAEDASGRDIKVQRPGPFPIE